LSLETATRAGSITLACGTEMLATRTGDAQVSHSTHLLKDVKEMFYETRKKLRDVELFAVALGPGSFTGLRIGLASIKAFATTLKRQSMGVPTLHAVAYAAGESQCTMALLPAGRGEVFAQLFKVTREREVLALSEPTHLSPEKLLDETAGKEAVLWAGEGAQGLQEIIRARALSEKIDFSADAASLKRLTKRTRLWAMAEPSGALSESVAALALQRYWKNETSGGDNLRAIYVRPSDAELKKICQE
jgi:tRNA threonylcarbamoyladenosine biosynthesis protein TsaB